MSLGVHNAVYRHAVIRPRWPRSRHSHSLRHFTPTSRSRSIDPDPPIRETPNPNARNIAILGGGVTGLTTAWNLTKRIPDAKITIYERNDGLGGWVNSEQVEVKDGEVLFEWGPRTLRPALTGSGRATVDLVLDLQCASGVRQLISSLPAIRPRPFAASNCHFETKSRCVEQIHILSRSPCADARPCSRHMGWDSTAVVAVVRTNT